MWPDPSALRLSRRAALLKSVAWTAVARAETVRLPFAGGPQDRPLTTAFPEKGAMILQRTRAPLLETPFAVFDEGVFTPNDRFFVRWHWDVVPTTITADTFRLTVHGHVERPLALSLDDLTRGFEAVELAAVNQCSGNSRGYFAPRVAGAQWSDGAMGNALWRGVRLRDVLDRAGIRAGAVQVRFRGLDGPSVEGAPPFLKSLALDHARDGEVMLAYAMNGARLPLLNGFPLRLVVPGWYSTYWVKMLSDIEVLDRPDDNFWMASAYRIPDNPTATTTPGAAGVPLVPISRMLPRSFVTSVDGRTDLANGATVRAGQSVALRGIAFGGATGVARVEVTTDGVQWQPAALGPDMGRYGFRRWQARVTPGVPGSFALQVRCTNLDGLTQPREANWNPSGYMRNAIETTRVTVL